jgi:phage anti-repressor protein
MFDMAVEIMPEFKYSSKGRHDRAWQVTMIERNEMGEYVRDVRIQRNNLTQDEAMSLANQLNQDLRKAEQDKKSDSQ